MKRSDRKKQKLIIHSTLMLLMSLLITLMFMIAFGMFSTSAEAIENKTVIVSGEYLVSDADTVSTSRMRALTLAQKNAANKVLRNFTYTTSIAGGDVNTDKVVSTPVVVAHSVISEGKVNCEGSVENICYKVTINAVVDSGVVKYDTKLTELEDALSMVNDLL